MTEILHATQLQTRPRDTARRMTSAWRRMLARLRRWLKIRRSRRQLAELDEHMLRDIGVTPAEALREIRVSFPWHLSFPWRDDGRPSDPWR